MDQEKELMQRGIQDGPELIFAAKNGSFPNLKLGGDLLLMLRYCASIILAIYGNVFGEFRMLKVNDIRGKEGIMEAVAKCNKATTAFLNDPRMTSLWEMYTADSIPDEYIIGFTIALGTCCKEFLIDPLMEFYAQVQSGNLEEKLPTAHYIPSSIKKLLEYQSLVQEHILT